LLTVCSQTVRILLDVAAHVRGKHTGQTHNGGRACTSWDRLAGFKSRHLAKIQAPVGWTVGLLLTLSGGTDRRLPGRAAADVAWRASGAYYPRRQAGEDGRMGGPQGQVDYFISYTSADRAWAEWMVDLG
jgi:hypothetical protein